MDGRKVNLKMQTVLQKLNEHFQSTPLKLEHGWSSMPCTPYSKLEAAVPSEKLTQAWLWPRFAGFLLPNDILAIETGTSQTDIRDTHFPKSFRAFTQQIFRPNSFAFAAGNERVGINRNILVTGEGCPQLTIQAFSNLLRHDLKPILFVLNNGGYTVERMIHGASEEYNHVPMWKYGELLNAFGVGYKPKTC